MTRENAAHVLIAGAGPTGLTAGWKLAEQGHRVTIIERAPAVGGMSASFEIAGQRVDFGSHRLHGRADPELLSTLGALMGDDLQTRERNGRIRVDGQWVGFPLRFGDLLTRLPRRFALGAAVDSITSSLRKPKGNDFGSLVRAGLGPRTFDAIYGPYAEKLWGLDASELDGSMAQRRVSANGPVDIAKRLLAARDESGRAFYYPRNGYGQIPEYLAAAALDANASIKVNTSLTRLSFDDQVIAGVVTSSQGTDIHEELRADVVVSTIPAQELVSIAEPAPPGSVQSAASSLEHRGMAFIYLVLPQQQYTSFDAHYFPGLDTVIARLSEPKNYRTGPDPENQTVICAEVACSVGDDIWLSEDQALGELVARQLEAQGLPAVQASEVHVRRLRSVYPVYRHGYRSHLDELEQWASGFDQMITVGRQGLFVPDNLHHAVAMGTAVSEAISLDGTIDRERWQRSRESFRAHVVED